MTRRPLRVLVIGGYGFFGGRLVRRLSREQGLDVVVAGRSIASAQALVAEFSDRSNAGLSAAYLDTASTTFERDLAALAPDLVVHTSGPFQGQQYTVAQACIRAAAH